MDGRRGGSGRGREGGRVEGCDDGLAILKEEEREGRGREE
jgi:hypothetical protein